MEKLRNESSVAGKHAFFVLACVPVDTITCHDHKSFIILELPISGFTDGLA